MPAVLTFEEFLPAFFGLFTRRTFKGGDFLGYLGRPVTERGGDEAGIVDTAVVGPLLELLGFAPGERGYNEQHQADRPDFLPRLDGYGDCFVVEDKNTTLALTLDLTDPDSHLSQMARYARARALRLGWLTNGRELTAWHFEDPEHPALLLRLDIVEALQAWDAQNPASLSSSFSNALFLLFQTFCKDTFASPERLERDLAMDLEPWLLQALPVGVADGHQAVLVEALQSLVVELQSDARRMLTGHLERYDAYQDKSQRLTDEATEPASALMETLRARALSALDNGTARVLGLESADTEAIAAIFSRVETDARAYPNPKTVLEAALEVVNAARRRKYPNKKAWTDLSEVATFQDALRGFVDTVFAWHQRQAALRQMYREAIAVHNDYEVWTTLVQETMLGGLTEGQRRDEFALQAAYVIFIRLLLIRVCEDKGIFPNRFLTDGGLKHWQEDIRRYLRFAQGNPYEPLLDMAYKNAQNIYRHFFTGRELFNWYQLDKGRFLLSLYQLSRFNFAEVNSDIVGTVYNTYVNRPEKKKKGQYYTPPEVVGYILDEIGYRSGPGIIGSSKRLIDPACGSGTFLVTAAKRLVAAYDSAGNDPLTVLARVRENLYGFDLNPFACYLAEVNLLIQVLDLVKAAIDIDQRPPQLESFHIYNVDALSPPSGLLHSLHYSTQLAEESEEVEQIKGRRPGSPYANGFAFVAANPPYGATLSPSYKDMLRREYPDVFQGQPDTYTFFFALGLKLLSAGGRLGFITPNTYLMGTNSVSLRRRLLEAGRVEQIVDLPQGLWHDATVDCVLLFLASETDAARRQSQLVQVNLMDLRDGDKLDKLTARNWAETLVQSQGEWLSHPRFEMNIRHDALLQQIEDACRVAAPGGSGTVVQRLGDITESSQGIIPYKTKEDGAENKYIKPMLQVPTNEPEWKPLLDGHSYIGRYELLWANERPYLKYGTWLWCNREAKYFDQPKLLVQDMRNRSLKRRLVAAFDDSGFYNRHNYSNIIATNPAYDLKYILALFNSSLLNYWFARRNDNLHINPSYFRQLPIAPADAKTQAEIVTQVDRLLELHAELNELRARGYTIRQRQDGTPIIDVPYDLLLVDMQKADSAFPTLNLFDARAAELLSIPEKCDLTMQIGSNVSMRDPDILALRHNRLWLIIPDAGLRRFLHGYLSRPQWRGRTWDEIKSKAVLPETPAAREALFAAEAQEIAAVQERLTEIASIDAAIDARVFALYGITDPADQARIWGSAPTLEEDAAPSEAGSGEES
jgi:type I restriction-modification system DNA methylase subunit